MLFGETVPLTTSSHQSPVNQRKDLFPPSLLLKMHLLLENLDVSTNQSLKCLNFVLNTTSPPPVHGEKVISHTRSKQQCETSLKVDMDKC